MAEDEYTLTMTRRSVAKVLGGAVAAGGVAASGLVLTSRRAVAATASLSASDVSLTSNAGQLQTLTVEPDMEYDWNGLDSPPKRIDFYVEVRLPDTSGAATTFEQVGTEGTTIDSSALESSSSKSYAFQNSVSVLGHSAIDDKDFEDTGEGWTKETLVDVQIRTVLEDEAGTTYTDTPQTSFTVTLTNETGGVNGGGNANPSGTAK